MREVIFKTWDAQHSHWDGGVRTNDWGVVDGVRMEVPGGWVEILPFDAEFHGKDSQSHRYPGQCAHGGRDTCPNPPFYSVLAPRWRISACPVHLYGAVAQARAAQAEASVAGVIAEPVP